MRNRHKAKKTKKKARSSGNTQVTDPNSPTTPADTVKWDEMASKLHADVRSFTPSPTPFKHEGGDSLGLPAPPPREKGKILSAQVENAVPARHVLPEGFISNDDLSGRRNNSNPQQLLPAPFLTLAQSTSSIPLSAEWWVHQSAALERLSTRSFHLSTASGYVSSTLEELTLLAEMRRLNDDGIKVYSEIIMALEGSGVEENVKVRRDMEGRLESVLEMEQGCRMRALVLQMKMHQEVNDTKAEMVDDSDESDDKDDVEEDSIEDNALARGRRPTRGGNAAPASV